MEIWKDIKGYENKYQVSTKGRVRRLEHYRFSKLYPTKILKHRYHNGYPIINLYKDKKNNTYCIHTLVAQEFIPKQNIGLKLVVNHIDGVKSNNCVSNLEWVSYAENLKHAIDMGLYKHNTQGCKDTNDRNALKIKLLNGYDKTFSTSREVAKYLIENNLISNKNLEGVARGIRACISKGTCMYLGYAFENISTLKYQIYNGKRLVNSFETLEDMAQWLLETKRLDSVSKATVVRKLRKSLNENKQYKNFQVKKR